MITALLCAVALGVAWLARRARQDGHDAWSLLLAGAALALATGPYGAPVVLLVLGAGAWVLRAEAERRDRERALVVAHLASVQVTPEGLEAPPPPKVTDTAAQRALAWLDGRHKELQAAVLDARSAGGRETPRAGIRARFMAAMGHELRSPLNSIVGFAQLLEDGADGPLSEAQLENVVLVRRAAEDLLTLLVDILDTARIEAGRLKLDRRWTAPVEVLTGAVERVKSLHELEGVRLDTELQPGLAPLMIDRGRMIQALTNVVRAVRGRGPLGLRVRAGRRDERHVVTFEVSDRSRWLNETELARAFDPDPDARPEGRSLALGLALSLADDLAQAQGGGAFASSSRDGTTWTLWVPQATSQEPPGERRRPRARPSGSRLTGGTGT
jgi:signal transduction histidine kinase